jgi:hypothetical protein
MDTQRLNNIPPGMDFQALGIEKVATALRDWGRRCLMAAFDGAGQASDAIRPLLALRTHARGWDARPSHRQRYAHNVLHALRFHRDSVLQQPVALAIGQSLDDSRRARRHRRQASRLYMPQPFWTLAGYMAWGQPDFQYWAAAYLQGYLRSRVLFALEASAIPTVHCNTFWLLLALVAVPQLKGRLWHRLVSPNRRKMAQQLAHIAKTEVLQSGWAGFWEQWIVAEMLTGSVPLHTLDTEVRRGLATLPILLQQPPYRQLATSLASATGKTASVSLAQPNWEAKMPRWFTQSI